MKNSFIKINEHLIGPGHPVYVIAEVGINHNGSLDLALEMIRAAKVAGSDAVKFQILTPERCYTRSSDSYPIFKAVELKKDLWHKIFATARQEGIDCFATFVDANDIKDYTDLDCPAYKISSSNVTNIPLLEVIATQGKPIILSSGLSYLKDVKEAVACLQANGAKEVAVLQCTAIYPSPFLAVNLNVLHAFKKEFPACPIGFSDHSQGVICAAAAVAAGACIIEKHFTLDKSFKGPDHAFSADPWELKALVEAVRIVEQAMGSLVKEPVLSEIESRNKMQRHIVAACDMKAGQILAMEHLGLKRSPQGGLEPKQYRELLGRRLEKDVFMDSPLTLEIVGNKE